MTVNFISAQTAAPIETGVSQTLAKWRAANYSDVRYKLNITLEKGAPLMKGTIEIRVNLTHEGAKNDLVLDWRATQFQNDKDQPYAFVTKLNMFTSDIRTAAVPMANAVNEHLILPKNFLKTGENVIEISFASPIKTSGSAITRYVDKEDNAEYIYSLFVPSDASTAFPVFDQPDLKARFQLNITAPINWKVISNARYLAQTSNDSFPEKPISETQLEQIENKIFQGDYRSASSDLMVNVPPKGTNWTYFRETKPISTYVFAFAAGEFASFQERDFSDVVSVHDMQIYVRKSQAEKFKQHAAEVFRLNREGVKFLESYFDYKFPFPKYDLVLIPEFPFGGMEHAGATFLRESSIIFPTEPTKNDYVSRANVIFHEAAHQWFGDTVTMKWFDDLWLKEGFAEFMAYKTLEKVMPECNAWKIFYERNKQAAYLTDSTKGTTPIYQEIKNLSAAKSAYGNIVYRKAPSFLKQAEFYLGADKFQTAVRAFLKRHEFANAEWTDLVKEFETASKQDLKDWANGWVKERGGPKVKARIEQFTNAPGRIRIEQYSSPFTGWQFKTQILWRDNNNKTQISTVEFKEAGTVYLRDQSDSPFSFIFPNYQDYGYGIFLLDEKSRAYVLANIQTEKDDFLRAMMWGSLWDSVREAELAPKDYVELVIKNLNLPDKRVILTSVKPTEDKNPPVFPETDEGTVNTLLGRVGTAMNYYLNDEERKKNAQQIERVLQLKIVWWHAPIGERINAFRAYVNLASTAESRLFLKSILKVDRIKTAEKDLDISKKSRDLIDIPPLRTKDRFDIVAKLLILGDEDAPALLSELEKTETSDEAKRYAYAAKAGIGTAENKATFWNDFVSNKEISESWIEAAFGSFNSPRHSDLTLPYLENALAELPNLKKTRKIFFVNGWLGAFVGGQKSEQALAIVNKFLADNPNLDKDLRLKILENADLIERAIKIRKKFGN